jgi:hypothetical protein
MYAAANPDVAKAAETAVNLGPDDDITVLTFTRLAAGEESTMSALEDGILAEPYSRSNQPSPVQRCSTVDLGSGRNHCQLVRRVLARLCDQNDSSMIGGRESSGTWGGN